MSADVRAMLAALDGLRIAGGCAECDAFTEVRSGGDGVSVMTVHHDGWCPDPRRHRMATTDRLAQPDYGSP